jgi:hypothetical protein
MTSDYIKGAAQVKVGQVPDLPVRFFLFKAKPAPINTAAGLVFRRNALSVVDHDSVNGDFLRL